MLRDSGHTAWHVAEIGHVESPDRDLWAYALDHNAVIVTKDEDFSLMFAMRGVAPTVVWVRAGNTRKAALLSWFEPLIDDIVDLIGDGQKLIELRSAPLRAHR